MLHCESYCVFLPELMGNMEACTIRFTLCTTSFWNQVAAGWDRGVGGLENLASFPFLVQAFVGLMDTLPVTNECCGEV